MSTSAMLSKIFINNVTVLDCAVWDLKLGPVGRSWNVDVEWIGHTDHEGVVIDFAAAKKLAKSVIDDLYDHRLLISEQSVRKEEGRFVCWPCGETPFDNRFLIDTYADSLAIFEHPILSDLSDGKTKGLESCISRAIFDRSPRNITEIRIRLREHNQRNEPVYFNYLHSLRLHQGNCQRFHGHSNIIEVFENGAPNPEKSAAVARYLNGKYLVAECYAGQPAGEALSRLNAVASESELTSDSFIRISYQGSQGQVNLLVPKEKLLLMKEESSIENISIWIHENLFHKDPSIVVYAYEGLNKGAVCP
jgi:6-pyruvoyl-tetrahydropterin synthase